MIHLTIYQIILEKKTQSRYNNCRDEEKKGFDLLSRRGYTLCYQI